MFCFIPFTCFCFRSFSSSSFGSALRVPQLVVLPRSWHVASSSKTYFLSTCLQVLLVFGFIPLRKTSPHSAWNSFLFFFFFYTLVISSNLHPSYLFIYLSIYCILIILFQDGSYLSLWLNNPCVFPAYRQCSLSDMFPRIWGVSLASVCLLSGTVLLYWCSCMF